MTGGTVKGSSRLARYGERSSISFAIASRRSLSMIRAGVISRVLPRVSKGCSDAPPLRSSERASDGPCADGPRTSSSRALDRRRRDPALPRHATQNVEAILRDGFHDGPVGYDEGGNPAAGVFFTSEERGESDSLDAVVIAIEAPESVACELLMTTPSGEATYYGVLPATVANQCPRRISGEDSV